MLDAVVRIADDLHVGGLQKAANALGFVTHHNAEGCCVETHTAGHGILQQ